MHITGKKLVSLLKISRSYRDLLVQRGALVSERINGTPHFSEDAINTFLARHCSHNLSTPLTLRILLRSELVTTIEAAELTGFDQSWIHKWFIDHGKVLYLRLPSGHVRIFKSSITMHKSRPDDVFSLKQVALISGFTLPGLYKFTADGGLRCQRDERRDAFVMYDDLIAFLKPLLPEWINPDDWLEDRLAAPVPLLTHAETEAQLFTTRKIVKELIAKQCLRYIQLGGRYYKILPDSVNTIIEKSGCLESPDIAKLFGVEEYVSAYWLEQGFMKCKVHFHSEESPSSCTVFWDCLPTFLTPLLPSDISLEEWMAAPQKTYDLHYASRYLGQRATPLVHAGLLKGIMTPTGRYRFTAEQLQICKLTT